MASVEPAEFAAVLEPIRHWPPDARRDLMNDVLKTLVEERPAPSPRGFSADQAVGLLRTSGPARSQSEQASGPDPTSLAHAPPPPSPVERAIVPASSFQEQFTVYRRNLPHWRLAAATYFVTWRLHKAQADLSPEERDVVVSALGHFDGERYQLFAYVVMNDHVHAIVKPLGDSRLEQILHSWKSFTVRQLRRERGRIGSVWQDESFDRIIRHEDEFWEKAGYILDNPAKRWPGSPTYRWAWLRSLGDQAGTKARPT